MPGQRKIRQPRFTPHNPALIGRLQLIRRIQRAEVHLDLITTAVEHRRTTARAEISIAPLVSRPPEPITVGAAMQAMFQMKELDVAALQRAFDGQS